MTTTKMSASDLRMLAEELETVTETANGLGLLKHCVIVYTTSDEKTEVTCTYTEGNYGDWDLDFNPKKPKTPPRKKV